MLCVWAIVFIYAETEKNLISSSNYLWLSKWETFTFFPTFFFLKQISVWKELPWNHRIICVVTMQSLCNALVFFQFAHRISFYTVSLQNKEESWCPATTDLEKDKRVPIIVLLTCLHVFCHFALISSLLY